MKRTIINLLAVCLLLCALAPAALALGPSDSGTCGEDITWELKDHTLTISGSGEMEDGCPWGEYESSIEHVVLTGGITKIGAKAFYGFDSIESVDFGDALVEIGENAFTGCDDIDYIHLPATFRTFGAGSFRDCASLKYVYCEGPMPRFNDSCLWTGNYISVFYRTDNPWPADSVRQLVSNFGGRLGIHMGNFEDAVLVAEAVEEEKDEEETESTKETEASTEEAVETEETVPETEAVEVIAEVVTEPETVPETVSTIVETEPTTVPTTEPEETTVETTEAPAPTEAEEESPAKKATGSSWIGLVLIAGVLTFFIAGALIFKIASRKGGRYTE